MRLPVLSLLAAVGVLASAAPAPAQCPYAQRMYMSMQQRSSLQFQPYQSQFQGTQLFSRSLSMPGSINLSGSQMFSSRSLNLNTSLNLQGTSLNRSSSLFGSRSLQTSSLLHSSSWLTLSSQTLSLGSRGNLLNPRSSTLFSLRMGTSTWEERTSTWQTRFQSRQLESTRLTTSSGNQLLSGRSLSLGRSWSLNTHTGSRPDLMSRDISGTLNGLRARIVTRTDLTIGFSATCGRCHAGQPRGPQPNMVADRGQPQPGIVGRFPGWPLVVGQPGPRVQLPLIAAGLRPVGLVNPGPDLPLWPAVVLARPALAKLPRKYPDAPGRTGQVEQPSPFLDAPAQWSPGQAVAVSPGEAAWLPSEPAGTLSRTTAANVTAELPSFVLAPLPGAAGSTQTTIPPPELPALPRLAWEPPALPRPAGIRAEPVRFLARSAPGARTPATALEPPPLSPLPGATPTWTTDDILALK